MSDARSRHIIVQSFENGILVHDGHGWGFICTTWPEVALATQTLLRPPADWQKNAKIGMACVKELLARESGTSNAWQRDLRADLRVVKHITEEPSEHPHLQSSDLRCALTISAHALERAMVAEEATDLTVALWASDARDKARKFGCELIPCTWYMLFGFAEPIPACGQPCRDCRVWDKRGHAPCHTYLQSYTCLCAHGHKCVVNHLLAQARAKVLP